MWGQRPLFPVLLLPLLLLGHAAASEKPTVVSTNPANGAVGVPKTLTSITITFSKPMDSVCRGVWTSNWIEGGSTCQWSADKLTMTFTRVDKTTPLTANATVGVTLNPMAYPPEIRDAEGNYLDPYYFSFTIEGESPVVTATDPVNNATDVSRTLASFSFTFNRAMDTSLCIPRIVNWPAGSSCKWSADGMKMTVTRPNPTDLLPAETTVTATLNGSGETPWLKDAGGKFLLPFTLRFTVAGDKLTVVSTTPADKATNVSRYLASISMTFSRVMYTSSCGASTANWPTGGACTWSADGKTMTLTRPNAATTPLELGKTVYIALNPTGAQFIKDAQGIYLDLYSFSFQIEGGAYELLKISADSSKGYEWPYYLSIPSTIVKPTVLLVEPNNTGSCTDDFSVHDASARSLVTYLSEDPDVSKLGSPILVPVFPRPASICTTYTHALDANTLKTTVAGLRRIDLQLISMVEDARSRLAKRNITLDPRFFITGASASGSFTMGFTILHPDLVKAAWAGAQQGTIVPVPQWNGINLPYGFGVYDLEQLVGKKFDAATFSKVPIQVMDGDEDFDSFANLPPGDPARELVFAVWGGPPAFERLPKNEAAYRSIGSQADFIVYPGVGHSYGPYWPEVWKFFDRNRQTPPPAPIPKPFLYTLYFPHVASFGQWETEIAIANTSEAAINGILRAHKAGGGDPTETMAITLPPGGRKEITVGRTFQKPGDIAYLSFLSDSGFIAGYTRFQQPGNRASLAVGPASNTGWFPKMEKDGWTGIAFVNVDAAAASVNLLALDDNGTQIAAADVSLTPGQKFVGMVDQLFKTDLSRATYFRYSSDRNILGFTVSGSSDGQMLDGLHALGPYIP